MKSVSSTTCVNQWWNTSSVLDWFRTLQSNSKSRFVKFDIVDFYPSISEELLNKSLDFAKSIVEIKDDVIDVIKLARKSLLFDKSTPWVKKGNELFDVTMGSYDGAETCELVGQYLLNKMERLLDKRHVGIYRDDGLAAVLNANGPQMDKLRKNIISIFKNEGLSITIETNLSQTDFLDVSFDITTKKFSPYRKPGNDPLYVNIKSNHPSSVLRAIPEMITMRIRETSCDETTFNNAKHQYEAVLSASGFKHKMTYDNRQTERRNRNRKVIWFNPPYSMNVKTNVGKEFLKIVKKHFKRTHKYHKIFNKNTLKLSYCCMTNVQNFIKQHNSKVLNKQIPTQRPCNCRNKNNCPLSGDCLATNIVYKADVTYNDTTATYYGLCEGEFKTRFNNHTKSFRHKKHQKETTLSELIWKLKDEGKTEGVDYNISWSIASRARPYKPGSRVCNLCIAEKVCIIRAEPRGLLNKRTELISKCRHRNKYSLRSLK